MDTETTRQRPRKKRIAVGDVVRVIPPHGEAGAVGTVERIYPANADYRARAHVMFAPGRGESWQRGWETIALDMLEVVS